ncbi:MAG: hypothetical protein ACREMY_21590, partial [bacterium]
MRFGLPVPAPYDAATYTSHEQYDLAPVEPADWKLTIGFDCADEIQLNAVCRGNLSAVPPWEIPSDSLPLLKTPPAAPNAITLYLTPLTDEDTLAINTELHAAGLGDEIRCFVYENVDPQLFPAAILASIRGHRKLNGLATNAARLDAFVNGEIPITVTADAPLGQAQYIAGTSGNRRLKFG